MNADTADMRRRRALSPRGDAERAQRLRRDGREDDARSTACRARPGGRLVSAIEAAIACERRAARSRLRCWFRRSAGSANQDARAFELFRADGERRVSASDRLRRRYARAALRRDAGRRQFRRSRFSGRRARRPRARLRGRDTAPSMAADRVGPRSTSAFRVAERIRRADFGSARAIRSPKRRRAGAVRPCPPRRDGTRERSGAGRCDRPVPIRCSRRIGFQGSSRLMTIRHALLKVEPLAGRVGRQQDARSPRVEGVAAPPLVRGRDRPPCRMAAGRSMVARRVDSERVAVLGEDDDRLRDAVQQTGERASFVSGPAAASPRRRAQSEAAARAARSRRSSPAATRRFVGGVELARRRRAAAAAALGASRRLRSQAGEPPPTVSRAARGRSSSARL